MLNRTFRLLFFRLLSFVQDGRRRTREGKILGWTQKEPEQAVGERRTERFIIEHHGALAAVLN